MADNKRPQSVSAKKARRNKLWRNVGIVVGAVALVALVLVSYFTSTTYYRQKTAVQIGSHDISVASFNYYYRNAYQNTYNAIQETYGEYASLLIDSSKPLDEQQYSDTQTWQDYLTDTTLANLEEIYAFYDAATAAGFTLDDDAKAEIEDIVASVASAAKQANYKLDNYLAAVYGKGVNEKLYRELLTVVTIATEYSADINEGFTFTDEETAAYYEENRNEIDSVTARVYPIAYETPEDDAGDADAPDNGDAADSGDAPDDGNVPDYGDAADGNAADGDTADNGNTDNGNDGDTSGEGDSSGEGDGTDDKADALTHDEALAQANGVYDAVETEQDFIDYVTSLVPEESKSKYEDGSAILYNGLSYSSFKNTDLSDWLFDDARVSGDIAVIEGESEVFLAMFLSRSDNDYPLVDMRHVLIAPEKDDEGNLVEGAEVAAKKKAEELYDEWVENGSTEDYFKILANTYSSDGDGKSGGLYEDVYKGRMVTPIDSWLFGPRKIGDCEIIESDYGWHLVYFAGFGENYKAQRLDDAMREDAYEAWRTDVMNGYEAKTVESGFKLTR